MISSISASQPMIRALLALNLDKSGQFNSLIKFTINKQYQQIKSLTQEHKDKQFIDAPTPFQKAKRVCILCKHKIKLDYKNPRLLSQFVSPLNGQIYDKHITGLCEEQQRILELEIKRSRRSMMMPVYYKDPKYNRDPQLFNPERPQRPNPH